ncbi:MAG: 4-hydroxy-tetrahydrodipicolinate reductase [Deltaproteobacteria bacterium RBG_16_64_85]|nr:MAG: 4-hydroxy-tetrahydrodipicolinate reductase [Deltaproteobacteria bacterium RBG_16_64_85]
MARVVVCGAMGRMGRAILAALKERPFGLEISGAVECQGHPLLGQDAFEAAGVGKSGVPVTDDFPKAIASADVAIDFTHAASSVGNARQTAGAGKAMVIGSTGFTPEQLSQVRDAAKGIPCVLSPNMSVGVNLMFKVAADVARILGDEYDVEIVEVHHRFKKDSPSGTAVRLADVVAGALGREMKDVGIYGREGMVGERSRKEIGVFAVRAGDVVGEHTLVFGGIGERFEITHRAHSRETFARGAVRAAAWVVGKPHGLYDMRAVLGIQAR